jgi:anthranilate phosphoribosyltransferase
MLIMRDLLKKMVKGENLSRQEARRAMEEMMKGEATPAQMASFLTSLRIKGETVDEIIGFAQGLRAQMTGFEHEIPQAVDTCGTGGDGGKTFNISTAAAFVAAAAGVSIVKHGNRAVSSKSGSADVLEALGIDIHHNAKEAESMLKETGVCFLFAPLFHRAMKNVMPTRTELGFRTIFNLLGPLANPAGVKYQLLGVYDPDLTEKVAHVLQELGVKKALVVAGLDGLDEISVAGPTRISALDGENVTTYEMVPEEFGISRSPLEAIRGGTAEENASLITDIFHGKRGAPRDVVLLNAGAVLVVGGKASTLAEGIQLAREAIDSGMAAKKLHQVIRMSREVRYVS